jgi:hypothetical protein
MLIFKYCYMFRPSWTFYEYLTFIQCLTYIYLPFNILGRHSSVSIATRYGLEGPGIQYRWERDFPHPSRPALGPSQPPVQWVPGLLPVGKAGGE